MKNIQDILQRYWEAETSVDEEDTLRAYFAGNEVAPQHREVQGLFAYQSTLRSLGSSRPIPQMDMEQGPSQTVVRQMSVRSRIGRIAAVALVLLSAGWFVMSNLDTGDSATMAHVVHLDDTQDLAETEEALKVTREALAYLTAKLDKNTRTVKTHVKTVQKANIFKY